LEVHIIKRHHNNRKNAEIPPVAFVGGRVTTKFFYARRMCFCLQKTEIKLRREMCYYSVSFRTVRARKVLITKMAKFLSQVNSEQPRFTMSRASRRRCISQFPCTSGMHRHLGRSPPLFKNYKTIISATEGVSLAGVFRVFKI